MKKTFNLLFFGPQGSGKGTQAGFLAKKKNLLHVSSGSTLRAISATKSPLGRYLKRQLASGTLTPIDKLMQVFEQFMKSVPKNQGIIFDGYSRQITETRIFLRKLKKIGRQIDLVILIEISDKESIKRLSKRAVCENCGRNLILGGKIKLGGKCPFCSGKITQRHDDTLLAIKRRLRIYRKRTLPVVRFYKAQDKLVTINGAQAVAKVHGDIVRVLKKKLGI